MFGMGALTKAFGMGGKAVGKGAMGLGNRMKTNMQNQPPQGQVGTDPSQSFMDRFKGGIPSAMNHLASAGQPEPMMPGQQQPQANPSGGFMDHVGPLIQNLLRQYQSPGQVTTQDSPSMPPPQMSGGMDVGPSMPFDGMMKRNRMHGMF